MKITKLVFSGGGIKGISYIGIIKYLEDEDLLKNINTIVGTSIGSVLGLSSFLGGVGLEPSAIFFSSEFNF